MRSRWILLLLVISALPIVVLAQAVLPAQPSCGVTQSCAALSYSASRTDGTAGFSCAGVGACLDMPGAHASVEVNDSGEICLGPENDTGVVVKIGALRLTGAGDIVDANGTIQCNNNCTITNIYKQINLDGARGVGISRVTSIPTCDATQATNIYMLGGTGVADHLCVCGLKADGTTYAWSSFSGVGTTTSCP